MAVPVSLIVPEPILFGTHLTLGVPSSLIVPPLTIPLMVVLSAPVPVKEKSICFSSGLKVIDSAAPLNFLNEPEPMKSLDLVKSVNPPTLNNPVLSYAAADVAVDPPKVKSIPSPSGGITNVLSAPVPVKENRRCVY